MVFLIINHLNFYFWMFPTSIGLILISQRRINVSRVIHFQEIIFISRLVSGQFSLDRNWKELLLSIDISVISLERVANTVGNTTRVVLKVIGLIKKTQDFSTSSIVGSITYGLLLFWTLEQLSPEKIFKGRDSTKGAFREFAQSRNPEFYVNGTNKLVSRCQ